MEDFLCQIEAALKNNLYYLALRCTLTLPDICGSLIAIDGEAKRYRYISWHDTYAKEEGSFAGSRGSNQPPLSGHARTNEHSPLHSVRGGHGTTPDRRRLRGEGAASLSFRHGWKGLSRSPLLPPREDPTFSLSNLFTGTGALSEFLASGSPPGGEEKVAAVVGLALLETIRLRDLPSEVLESEDPTRTLPRRLGLSEVVDQQIRRFDKEVQRGRRITQNEARDLFQLVIRRPNSEEVFLQAGELLAQKDGNRRRVGGLFPRRARDALARRVVQRRILALFGRSIGAFAHGPFTLEARNHFLLEMDPGGDACLLLSGFCQAVLSRLLGEEVEVTHDLCQARKDQICRWALPARRR